MRILIVDDHVIFRAGLKQLLLEEIRTALIEEAGSGATALQKLRDGKWDVVLLDIKLPDKNGIEVLKNIRQINPKQPVLILSMFSEQQYAVRALRAGAAGYLTKETSPPELLKAIRQVAEGRKYINELLAIAMAAALQTRKFEGPPHDLLSDREYDIFMKLSEGKTVSEIADMINLSVKTVSTYRSRILKKMNMKNNAELMQYAVLNKLHIKS